MSEAPTSTSTAVRSRPKSFTVFAAAFLAGAAAAVGVNRVLDVHLAQRKPQVECEPIFVALRALQQGDPVTVWDVALRDWPKAMLPASALRADDSFEGFVLRHAIREGQPLLAVQLVRSDAAGGSAHATAAGESFTAPIPAPQPTTTQNDLWTPAGSLSQAPAPAATEVTQGDQPRGESPPDVVEATPQPVAASTAAAPTLAQPTVPEPSATEPTVAEAENAETGVETDAVDAQAATTSPAEQTEPSVAVAVTPSSPLPPSPTDIDPAPARKWPTPTLARQEAVEAVASDATSADVKSMPSVVTPPRAAGDQAAAPRNGGPGRYLVVPERIAMQADTSFTTPRPQPPAPPAVIKKNPTGANPTPGGRSAAAAPTNQRGPAAARGNQPRSENSQAVPGQRGGLQQPATGGAPAARRGPQQRPSQPAAPSQPAGQQAPRNGKQAATNTERTWGGMFPNVAAGLEAMGSPWQKSRTGTTAPAARR